MDLGHRVKVINFYSTNVTRLFNYRDSLKRHLHEVQCKEIGKHPVEALAFLT